MPVVFNSWEWSRICLGTDWQQTTRKQSGSSLPFGCFRIEELGWDLIQILINCLWWWWWQRRRWSMLDRAWRFLHRISQLFLLVSRLFGLWVSPKWAARYNDDSRSHGVVLVKIPGDIEIMFLIRRVNIGQEHPSLRHRLKALGEGEMIWVVPGPKCRYIPSLVLLHWVIALDCCRAEDAQEITRVEYIWGWIKLFVWDVEATGLEFEACYSRKRGESIRWKVWGWKWLWNLWDSIWKRKERG